MTEVINLFSVAFAFVARAVRVLAIGTLVGAIICSPFVVAICLLFIYWD